MNILYKFRFSFLLAFLGICLFLTTNTAYGLDSLAKERLRKHIHSQMDKQIAQNALNDKLGKSNLNEYVMNINTLDPDETDHFKINEVNNGKTLWNLSGAAFSSPTNGIKKILQDANAGLVDKPKVYLVLIAIYDYNEAVLKWDKEKQRPTTAVNWGEKLKELADKKGNKNATENTNPRFNNGENRTNLGSFVTSIVASKITGTQISPYSIACFSMYIAKVDKTVTPAQVTYDINTSIYRQEDVPKSVLDIIDPIANSCLNTPDRNECLRKVIEVLCASLVCNSTTPTERATEVARVATELNTNLTNITKRIIILSKATSIFPLAYTASELEILNGQLQVLDQKTGYKLYIVVDNSGVFPCENANLMANEIYQASNLPKSSAIREKTGLVYINLARRDINITSNKYAVSIFNSFGTALAPYLNSLATNSLSKYNDELLTAGNQSGFTGLIESYTKKLYKALPKPAKLYNYTVSKNGVLKRTISELPVAVGRDKILSFNLVMETFNLTTQTSSYVKWIAPIKEHHIEGMIMRPTGGTGVGIMDAFAGGCILRAYSQRTINLTEIEFNHYNGPNIPNVPNDALSNGANVSSIVVGLIDFYGVLFAPIGLDVVPDFFGMVYAIATGNWENATIYGGSMFVPFVAGGAIKLGMAYFFIPIQGLQNIKILGFIANNRAIKNADNSIEVTDLIIKPKIEALDNVSRSRLSKDIETNEEILVELFENTDEVLLRYVDRTLKNAGKIHFVDEFIQSPTSISQKITKSFEQIEQLSNAGQRMSTKTAKKLSNDGVVITDLDNLIISDKVKTLNNGDPTAGDRDLGTATHLIECKTTLSNRKFSDMKNQIDKMVEVPETNKGPLRQFINPTNKKVIIYTEENLQGVNTYSLSQIKAYASANGVKIIDNYADLLNELK